MEVIKILDIDKKYRTILDSIEGLIVIDKNEKIVYVNDDALLRFSRLSREEMVGRPIRSIASEEINRLYKVLYTGEPQIGEIYFFEGDIFVCNDFPIYKNGKLIGACEYNTFKNAPFLQDFLDKIYSMNSELRFYKEEYEKMRMTKYSINDIIGQSDAVRSLKGKIYNAAKSLSTVLIQGETGTGKELVAHSIHRSGQRAFNHFVKINCAAIPENLFEAEIFGYEAGSFTDASLCGKIGKAEFANGGTMFFDEIDQLTLNEQAKLLRFLQEKEVIKIGASAPRHVDVRIIASTNQNLEKMMQEGRFRQDLYYRLSVVEIKLEPLRNRKEDISLLVEHFIRRACISIGKKDYEISKISDEALIMLYRYDWPGNVRELQNVIERAVNNCESDVLQVYDFGSFALKILNNYSMINVNKDLNLENIKNKAEKEAIVNVLKYTKKNMSEAHKILGVSRQLLYKKIKKHNIDINQL